MYFSYKYTPKTPAKTTARPIHISEPVSGSFSPEADAVGLSGGVGKGVGVGVDVGVGVGLGVLVARGVNVGDEFADRLQVVVVSSIRTKQELLVLAGKYRTSPQPEGGLEQKESFRTSVKRELSSSREQEPSPFVSPAGQLYVSQCTTVLPSLHCSQEL